MNGTTRGRGGQGGGRGRKDGPLAGGAGGTCICPNCGHREPHQQCVPCTQVKCPQCGTGMIRE